MSAGPFVDVRTFGEWNAGAKTIVVAFALALVSMALSWVDNGIRSASGFSQWSWLFLIVFAYPLAKLIRGMPIDEPIGLACGIFGILFSVAYIATRICWICGQMYFFAGYGPFVFLAASAGLLWGVMNYEAINWSGGTSSQPERLPYALPTAAELWDELDDKTQTLVKRVLYGLVVLLAVGFYFLVNALGGLSTLQVVSRFDRLSRRAGTPGSEAGEDARGKWFAIQTILSPNDVQQYLGMPDAIYPMNGPEAMDEWVYRCPDGDVKLAVDSRSTSRKSWINASGQMITIRGPAIRIE